MQRKKLKLVAVLIALSLCGLAQNGMDYAGQQFAQYSRLRSNFPLFQQNARNEKALGVFQSNITPQSFLEVNSTPAYMPFPMGSIALGEVFRTTSPIANNAAWRMFTGTGATAQKFSITVPANSNDISIGAIQNGNMLFSTNNTPRMFINSGSNNYPGGNNAGYISVGNPPANAPLFNISVLTNSVGLGDFLIGGTTTKSPNSLMGLIDASATAGTFVPTYIGSLDNQQQGPAISTIGNIDGAQDLAPGTNNYPVHRFIVGRGFTPFTTGLSSISEINNRVAFTWQNAGTIKMLMNANGRLLIGAALTIPGTLPNNRVEITSSPTDPFFGSVNGSSGLRLTNMLSTASPLANPGSGVLSVDQFGDVIYVNSPLGGGGFGNLCIAPQNPLLGNYEVPLNNFEFNFSGDNTNVNKVNVGLPCGTPTFGKFNVNTAFQTDPTQNRSFSIYGSNTYNGNLLNTGVYGEAVNTAAFFERGVSGFASAFRDARGVYGEAGTVSNGAGWGGYFLSTTANNPNNFGATGVAGNATFRNEGVIGTGLGGQICHGGNFAAFGGSNVNIGVSGIAYPTSVQTNPSTYPSGINIGVYGNAPQSIPSGVVQDCAGFFDGDVWINGPSSGGVGGFAVVSDLQFKSNIDTIANPLFILTQLKPKQYFLDTNNIYGMRFSGKKQYGFIAQDVQTILPELVSKKVKPAMVDTLGAVVTPSVAFKDLNYNAFFALLTAGMQKQQSQIEKQDSIITLLTTQLAALTQSVSSCCSNSSVRTTGIQGTQIDVELSDKDVITLSQNVPNPYAEQTTITYNVPEQYGFAQIIFKTVDGKIIKAVDITKKGKGQLNVFASDLSQGLYMYTLIVDGKVIDTKKMVKQ